MMGKQRKWVSVLVMACLLLALLPAGTAQADNATSVYVGGVEMVSGTDTTYYKNGDTVSLTGTSTDYNAKYDPGTATLTLNDFTYNGAGYSFAAIYANGDLTIVLEGTNSVTHTDGGSNSSGRGIYVDGGALTISGDGSLTATGGTATSFSYGICSSSGNITISGNAEVTATGGKATSSSGIFGYDAVTIEDNAKVTATGGEATLSFGIDSVEITISGNAKVDAKGGTATSSCGIYSGGVTISGGNVTAEGGEATNSFGIDSGEITISGNAEVTATGGKATLSYGIDSYGDVTIEDNAEVTAEGGEATSSSGIYSLKGNITISDDAKVDAKGGTAKSSSSGIESYGGVTISGGIINASGSTVTATCSSASHEHDDDYYCYADSTGIYAQKDLHIKSATIDACGGNASVTNTDCDDVGAYSNGIYVEEGSFIVMDATITATGGKATVNRGNAYSEGIEANDMTILGGSKVVCSGGTATATGSDGYAFNCGIYSWETVEVDDTSAVTANGGTATAGSADTDSEAESYGICAGDIDVSGAAEVTASGGAATGADAESWGINAGYDFYARDNCKVIGTGGHAQGTENANSCGIGAINYDADPSNITCADSCQITATGGAATASGERSYAKSCGVYALSAVTISGGIVNATAPNLGNDYSAGVQSDILNVSGGILNASGSTYGVYVDDSASFSGGITTAVTSNEHNSGFSYNGAGYYLDSSGMGIKIGDVQDNYTIDGFFANGGVVIDPDEEYPDAAPKVRIAPAENETIDLLVGQDNSSGDTISLKYWVNTQGLVNVTITNVSLAGTGSLGVIEALTWNATSITYTIKDTLTAGSDTYTVKFSSDMTDPPTTFYATLTFEAVNPPSRSSGGGGGSAAALTVPVTGEDTVRATAAVKGATANIAITDEQLDKVLGAGTDAVTIDVSSFKNVDAVVVPERVVDAIADEGGVALTIETEAASVTLDAAALATAAEQDGDLRLVVEKVERDELTAGQQAQIGEDAIVLDLQLWKGDTRLSDFDGGAATVRIPYEGEPVEGMIVWRMTVDADGNIDLTPLAVTIDRDNQCYVFVTGQFSAYVLAYFPFTDVDGDKWYYENVAYAFVNDLFKGTGETTFAPETAMSRAML
ncbi:MAG: S-layer homology domain-containing protein, partial [Syntrophomonadaceae bacterium]|nr:S-layer homology domain-containing protein [Syntrophomonadaceae bacterium]